VINSAVSSLFMDWTKSLSRRSARVAPMLSVRMKSIATIWLSVMVLVSVIKLVNAATPAHNFSQILEIFVPYALVALAPIAGYVIAKNSFPQCGSTPQPTTRMSAYGKWRKLNISEALASPDYGPAGFMASLLIGMLLNVVLRTAEYMAAIPAMHSAAPDWGQALFLAMTADLVIMNFFYMACFVMALRTVPLFPRMLLFAWILDVCLQLGMAQFVSSTPPPSEVASALKALLIGNLHKVLISAALWLPYLILSRRVNVTYRCRLPAQG
jgi:hypothetical protein